MENDAKQNPHPRPGLQQRNNVTRRLLRRSDRTKKRKREKKLDTHPLSLTFANTWSRAVSIHLPLPPPPSAAPPPLVAERPRPRTVPSPAPLAPKRHPKDTQKTPQCSLSLPQNPECSFVPYLLASRLSTPSLSSLSLSLFSSPSSSYFSSRCPRLLSSHSLLFHLFFF